MKGYKFIILFLIISIVCSCGSNDNVINDEERELIEEMEEEGFKYVGPAQLQNGIYDTVMFGYTDRKNGIFHNKSERFNELKIKGYKFEKTSDELYKQRLLIFSFEFNDVEEKKKFEEFQKYILNYQIYSKNQVEFYQKNEKWYLRFGAMP